MRQPWGWGRQGVAYSDLQVRVYELEETVETAERRIKAEGIADIKRFSGKEPVFEQELDAQWRRTLLSFPRFYGDYGATAHVDFRVRQFDNRTFAFVFMYTSYQSQEKAIASILGSFGVPR